VNRLAAICLVVGLAGGAAGCGHRLDRRTGKVTLEQAISKAFKRQYAAAYRMSTGHAYRRIIRYASFRCRPLGPEPRDANTGWPWACRARYYTRRVPDKHFATYDVRVDAVGCFKARSDAFIGRLTERALGNRFAADPLIYIRSCP
jgi:hypothetical protein